MGRRVRTLGQWGGESEDGGVKAAGEGREERGDGREERGY